MLESGIVFKEVVENWVYIKNDLGVGSVVGLVDPRPHSITRLASHMLPVIYKELEHRRKNNSTPKLNTIQKQNSSQHRPCAQMYSHNLSSERRSAGWLFAHTPSSWQVSSELYHKIGRPS